MTKYIDKRFLAVSKRRTICEVLREVFWLTEDETIRTKVDEAERMAKRMDAKLREYKQEWDDEEWDYLEEEEVSKRVKDRQEKYKEQECLK